LQGFFAMAHLEDGDYDVIVIDAREDGDRVLHVDLALTSGAHKGEVITVAGAAREHDALALLGLPATLRVVNGEPRLTMDA
jgi:regulator of RNase E activity RraA